MKSIYTEGLLDYVFLPFPYLNEQNNLIKIKIKNYLVLAIIIFTPDLRSLRVWTAHRTNLINKIK